MPKSNPTDDPVADLGRELRRLWQRHRAADRLAVWNGRPKQHREHADRFMDAAFDGARILHHFVLETRATSFGGVLTQLIVLTDLVDDIANARRKKRKRLLLST